MDRGPARGALLGLGAALLFGLSAPVAKLLAPSCGPLVLAGLLYLGGGAGLLATRPLRPRGREAPLRRADLGPLAVVVLAGGVVGPWLLILGLQRLEGVTASLLLNLEAPFTMVLAIVAFREALSWREVAGAAAVLAGGAAIGLQPGPLAADRVGVAALAGACAAWALDNNLSQRLSVRDPASIGLVKTMSAGGFNLLLGWALGQELPAAGPLAAALATGALGFGLSIELDLLALRHLGAAREAAYFATAPFFGALAAVPLLGERLGRTELLAGAAMALGVLLLVRARHEHLHVHAALEHDHLHRHDTHHQHPHPEGAPKLHAHPHRHEPLEHAHPHASDAHHRHRHR